MRSNSGAGIWIVSVANRHSRDAGSLCILCILCLKRANCILRDDRDQCDGDDGEQNLGIAINHGCVSPRAIGGISKSLTARERSWRQDSKQSRLRGGG
jgi:hypothetical protein